MREEKVVRALLERRQTVATAESLTAGLLSAALCNVPGASGCFLGGVAAYQDEVKEKTLGVPRDVIDRHTAVSAPCARAMARGAREMFGAAFALSTTGYAGPTGENVGLVYVGLADERKTRAYRLHFSGSRQGIRQMTVLIALYLLQKEIKEHGEG